ncbi:hypothetical protein Dda_1765 [Drechslerella dactyloides]|uniref:Uncharacterized protein n=1 Tax=Drechslerella dactyloides TaxID=74499 RepID=A0AAD6J296_DREDA|nr:hypothetical protein Dda_1765 [Drechslerella dactyloides]
MHNNYNLRSVKMKSGFSTAFALLPLTIVNAGLIPRQITSGTSTVQLQPGYNFGTNGDALWASFHTPATCDSVELHWAVGNAWATATIVPEGKPEASNAPGATQFYIKASCNGKDVYAPGNGANYPVPPKPEPVIPKIIAQNYGINGNHLYGEFFVPYNCKSVNIFWAKGTEFQDAPVAAELRSPARESYYATWGVEAETPGATQFYIKATCDGKELVSPGNFVNYQLPA